MVANLPAIRVREFPNMESVRCSTGWDVVEACSKLVSAIAAARSDINRRGASSCGRRAFAWLLLLRIACGKQCSDHGHVIHDSVDQEIEDELRLALAHGNCYAANCTGSGNTEEFERGQPVFEHHPGQTFAIGAELAKRAGECVIEAVRDSHGARHTKLLGATLQTPPKFDVLSRLEPFIETISKQDILAKNRGHDTRPVLAAAVVVMEDQRAAPIPLAG